MNKVMVGANAICRINGAIFGAVTGLQYRLLSPRFEERGLDDLEPVELGPTITSVQGTVQVMMLRDDNGLEGRGITAGLPFIPTERYFSLTIQEAGSGFIIMVVPHASIEEQSWSMSAKNLVTGQFTFKGIQAWNHFNQ